MSTSIGGNHIREFTVQLKRSIFHIFIFSIFYNLLLFSSPIYMLQIYNRIIPSRSEETLLWLTILIFFLFIILSLLDIIRKIVFIQIGNKFDSIFISKIFSNQLRIDDGIKVESQTCTLQDAQRIKTLLSKGHLAHFFDILWFPIFAIAIFLLHPLLACMLILGALWLGTLAVGSHVLTSRTIKDKRSKPKPADVTSTEILANAEIVRSLGMISPLLRRWEKSYLKASDEERSLSERLTLIAATGKASCLLFQSLTLGLGAYLAINDVLSAGGIVAASILVGRALAPIEAAILAWNRLLETKGSISRVLNLIDSEEASQQELDLGTASGQLVVNNLTCATSQRAIFRNISFEVERGAMVSIIGPNGAGKSTLARHLVGLQPGTEGFVRFDGKDLYSMRDEMRLKRIGYMAQELDDLSGNVVDYIGRFGSFFAEDVLNAASITSAHDMIMDLPEKYSTKLGLGGDYLSAGQRKRLSLARACCGIPELIVLDDPCAYMDEAGERSLLKTIAELRLHETIVCVVTNKTSIIHQSDLLVVLNTRGESRIGRPGDIFSMRLHAIASGTKRVKSTR